MANTEAGYGLDGVNTAFLAAAIEMATVWPVTRRQARLSMWSDYPTFCWVLRSLVFYVMGSSNEDHREAYSSALNYDHDNSTSGATWLAPRLEVIPDSPFSITGLVGKVSDRREMAK